MLLALSVSRILGVAIVFVRPIVDDASGGLDRTASTMHGALSLVGLACAHTALHLPAESFVRMATQMATTASVRWWPALQVDSHRSSPLVDIAGSCSPASASVR